MMDSIDPPRTRRIPLFALYTANAISLSGNVLTLIAVPWFVLQTTGSPARTGITAAVELVATILAAFFGGALVDRLEYRRSSILSDLASGATIAAIPTLYSTVGLAFWQLLSLVAVAAFFYTPGATARQALLPDLAQMGAVRLERANGIAQGIERGSRLVGGALVGILIAFAGASNVLYVDAATFLISALLIGLLVPRQGHAHGSTGRETAERKKSYLRDLGDGLCFLWRAPLIRAIVLTVMMTNLLDAPFTPVILPVYAQATYHSAEPLGLAVAAFGAGSLLGVGLYLLVGYRLPRRVTFIALFVVVGLRFWVLALIPSLPVMLATLAVAGLASGPLNPIIGTVAQEHIPAALRGRVFGVISAGANMAMPIALIGVGYLLQVTSVQVVLLAEAVCYLAVTLSMLFSHSLRAIDHPPQTLAAPDQVTADPTPVEVRAEATRA
jgi:MFS family permease